MQKLHKQKGKENLNKNYIKSLLELGRVSNLPTCVSNTTAGYYLGGGNALETPMAWLAAVFCVSLLYVSGMVLNDLLDRTTDAVERPLRPIPSGRIKVQDAWWLYGVLSLMATLIVVLFIPSALNMALLLVVLIFAYNWTHRSLRLSPLMMGGCRGLVYLLAASAAGWKWGSEFPNLVWIMSAILWAYVTLLSLIAREELSDSASALQMAFLGFSVFAFILPLRNIPSIAMASGVGLLWLGSVLIRLHFKRIPPIGAVGRMLAAISLLDGLTLASVGASGGVFFAWGCFAGTLAWHRRIQGT